MLLKILTLLAFASSLYLVAGLIHAADQIKDQTQDKTKLREQIYGSQLMTEQERFKHRNQMHNFKTEQERESYRLEHHKRMQERAKERGMTLPEEPMMRPGGVGGRK